MLAVISQSTLAPAAAVGALGTTCSVRSAQLQLSALNSTRLVAGVAGALPLTWATDPARLADAAALLTWTSSETLAPTASDETVHVPEAGSKLPLLACSAAILSAVALSPIVTMRAASGPVLLIETSTVADSPIPTSAWLASSATLIAELRAVATTLAPALLLPVAGSVTLLAAAPVRFSVPVACTRTVTSSVTLAPDARSPAFHTPWTAS